MPTSHRYHQQKTHIVLLYYKLIFDDTLKRDKQNNHHSINAFWQCDRSCKLVVPSSFNSAIGKLVAVQCFGAWIHWHDDTIASLNAKFSIMSPDVLIPLAKKRVFRPAINESRFSDSCGYDNLTTIKLLLYLPFVNWWETQIETLKLCDFNFKAYQMGRNIFTICNVYLNKGGKNHVLNLKSSK